MDTGLLATLTDILRGGGPFAAFILMIWFLEPRFRTQMQQPHRAAVFIPVYVLNLVIAVLMLFAAIYFWFVQEGVLGDESILAKGNVSNVPVTHVLYSRNEELYLRRNQREGSGYLYDWIVLSEDSDYDEDLFLLLSPIADRAGATERYFVAWGDIDPSRTVELQYRSEDGSMCMRVRTDKADECRALARETLVGALDPAALPAPGGGVPFWRELLVRSAHAEDVPLTDPYFLADLLRSPDVFERRDARAALIAAGPEMLSLLDKLVALDPESYRINLAVLTALNAWEIADAGALPDSVMSQAPLWLTWPDAALRDETVSLLARTLSPAQAARLLSQAAEQAKEPPADTAVSIAASDLYRALARRGMEEVEALVRSGDTSGAVFDQARQVNAFYARAFEALVPAAVEDETAATLVAQTRLDALGLQVGAVNGVVGPATRTAVAQFGDETGVKPPETMAALEPALLAAQRAEVLEGWRRALAALAGLVALQEGELEAMDVRWSFHARRLIDESPQDYRDLFGSRVEAIGAGGFVDDPTALYAEGLRAALARDWPRALEALQLVQRFDGDISDAQAIELLIRRNLEAFAKDEAAVAFALGQILWCYNDRMPDDVTLEYKAWAEEAGVAEARCSY